MISSVFARLALLVTLGGAFAGPRVEAADGLDRVVKYYQDLKDFSAEFQQDKILAAEDLTLKGRGLLHVSLGRALLWEVVEPAPLAVFVGADQLKIRAGSGAARKDSTYDLKQGRYSEKLAASMRELTSLLVLDFTALRRTYKVTESATTVTLVPLATHAFQSVVMTIADGHWIARIAITERSGDTLDLVFRRPVAAPSDQWIAAWTKNG